MAEKIVLAGATGNLGTRIAYALSKRGADVVALGRIGARANKLKALESLRVKIRIVDMASVSDLAKESDGAACVGVGLAGMHVVHFESVTILLVAPIASHVPTFTTPAHTMGL